MTMAKKPSLRIDRKATQARASWYNSQVNPAINLLVVFVLQWQSAGCEERDTHKRSIEVMSSVERTHQSELEIIETWLRQHYV
jgi:hypothetical protein